MTEQAAGPWSSRDKRREFVEHLEVQGDQLLSKIKELVSDSRTRRIVLRSADGKEILSLPMNVGLAAGGIATLAAPMLAAVGAIAALVTHVRLDVVREGAGEPSVQTVTDATAPGATETVGTPPTQS